MNIYDRKFLVHRKRILENICKWVAVWGLPLLICFYIMSRTLNEGESIGVEMKPFLRIWICLLPVFIICAVINVYKKDLAAISFNDDGFIFYSKFYHKNGQKVQFSEIKECYITQAEISKRAAMIGIYVYCDVKRFYFDLLPKLAFVFNQHRDNYKLRFKASDSNKQASLLECFGFKDNVILTEDETFFLIKSFCKKLGKTNGEKLLAKYRKRHKHLKKNKGDD